ncbi:MAG: tRNA (adenosine(37)-N6)-threonylcarbamoyltransferase complex dimerization subunit type 1 TsaB [Rickettsiales bacterium]|nr:tRNA (adenosine(37)-N6)-threonylcarbamoyltransferase complex dimerization subunit type 1 TsaB [Rickettsiales bacterium]
MPNILCIETSIGKCSVALNYDNAVDHAESEQKFVQSEQLFVLIIDILKKNQCSFKDIDVMSCTIGPGSFTGIRIGLAAIYGMKKVLNNVQLLGVSTLELMVRKLNFSVSEKKILAVLNATSGDLYAQEFNSSGKSLGVAYLISQESLLSEHADNTLLLTESSSFSCEHSVKVDITAQDLLKYVSEVISNGKESLYENLQPMYLKEPNVYPSNLKTPIFKHAPVKTGV